MLFRPPLMCLNFNPLLLTTPIYLKINSEFIKGSDQHQVTISRLKNFSINHRLSYLISYPYGCIEQTTSAVFPQLYLKDIQALSQ